MRTKSNLLIPALACVLLWPVHLPAPTTTNEPWTMNSFLGPKAMEAEVTALVRGAATNSLALRQLGNARTEHGRAALLRIAYGENAGRDTTFAAFSYAHSLEDKSQARALLVAKDPEAVVAGLLALIGQQVDPNLLARLSVLMQATHCRIREYGAAVLTGDTNAATAAEKARLIIDSMNSTPSCEDAQSRTSVDEAWFFHPWEYQELALKAQAFALGRMKGITPEFLSNVPLPGSGIPRDYLLLAKDAAGDKSTYPELRRALTNSSSILLRFEVLARLLASPDAEDLAVVRKVAEGDPFVAEPTFWYFMKPGADKTLEFARNPRIYPLRIQAQQGLNRLAEEEAKKANPAPQSPPSRTGSQVDKAAPTPSK